MGRGLPRSTDDGFLEIAVNGGADIILTGDVLSLL
jgi:predicted nucleic acid-binding protein